MKPLEYVQEQVAAYWNEVMPNSQCSTQIKTLHGKYFEYLVFKGFLAKDSSEFEYGISHNDPLSFTVIVYQQFDGTFNIDFVQSLYTGNPKVKCNAYSTYPIRQRGANSLDAEKTIKRLKKSIDKVLVKLREGFEAGNLSVFDGKKTNIAEKLFNKEQNYEKSTI